MISTLYFDITELLIFDVRYFYNFRQAYYCWLTMQWHEHGGPRKNIVVDLSMDPEMITFLFYFGITEFFEFDAIDS